MPKPGVVTTVGFDADDTLWHNETIFRLTHDRFAELLGDRPAALCRELTKLHEDTVRTTLSQAAEWYRTNEPRGEYVLVVAGREKQDAPPMTLEEGVARVLALRD